MGPRCLEDHQSSIFLVLYAVIGLGVQAIVPALSLRLICHVLPFSVRGKGLIPKALQISNRWVAYHSMSKEEKNRTGNEPLAEVIGNDFRVAIRCLDWSDAVVQVCVGKTKIRIAALAGQEVGYDFKSGRWFLVIPETVGQIKDRVALALLSNFPGRVSRDNLSVISSVQADSLRNYLTKPELEVQPHVNENKDGVVLNETGLEWAFGVLKSLEQPHK